MNDRPSEERKWLERVGDNIKWRIDGPDIKNPFDASINEARLEDLISDKSMLLESCEAVAVMDETEILRITDLSSLRCKSEHPNLVNISPDQLDAYLKDKGVWNVIEDKLEEFRKECQFELEKRRG